MLLPTMRRRPSQNYEHQRDPGLSSLLFSPSSDCPSFAPAQSLTIIMDANVRTKASIKAIYLAPSVVAISPVLAEPMAVDEDLSRVWCLSVVVIDIYALNTLCCFPPDERSVAASTLR